MKILFIIINFIALLWGLHWVYSEPSPEPVITSLVLLWTFLTQILTNEEIKSKIKLTQKNKSKESHNYQAWRDQTVTDNKIIQKGWNDSQQIQSDTVIIKNGISEERVRYIYEEKSLKLKNFYTSEALKVANQRVWKLENILIPKMKEIDWALEIFWDPSFQLLLVEAQKTAAATERSADYDLLSELLVHRFNKNESRIDRAAINRAVEIVDNISNEALLILTISHAISFFVPVGWNAFSWLDALNSLFWKLLYKELPQNDNWLDHLDILDAVRVNSLWRLKKTQEYYVSILSWYVDIGIKKHSKNHTKALELLKINNLSHNILVDSIYNNEYLVIPVTHRNEIKSLKKLKSNWYGKWIESILSKEESDTLESIYDLYVDDNSIKQENIKLFMQEWNKRKNLKILWERRDKIWKSFNITSVGKVLAHSNAQRCDSTLPPLN
jgi:hypothetical protein